MQENVHFIPIMIKLKERERKSSKEIKRKRTKRYRKDIEKRKEMKTDSFPYQIPLGTTLSVTQSKLQEDNYGLLFFFKVFI